MTWWMTAVLRSKGALTSLGIKEQAIHIPKGEFMANKNENRVLNRMGAREVTAEEVKQVTGSGNFNTNVCTISLDTGAKDGDACH